ncbi:hypothetical protein [Pedobacter borealis]|uniref:hypothetical protein n=1 Tax=Pedobacter borealis TaxID=475254 RepID=UPI00068A550C|nr:hypothetical protein [Pedobacter borealis]
MVAFTWLLIYFSGILEIVFGVLLLIKRTRKLAAVLIILMLIAFMPTHICMIQKMLFIFGKILATPFYGKIAFTIVVLMSRHFDRSGEIFTNKEISPFRYATVEMTILLKKYTTKLDFVGL